MNRQSGFSLVETLLACGLAAVVSLAMISMLSGSLRTTGNSGNKINFLNFVELLNDRLQYPVYCSAHIVKAPFNLAQAGALDPLISGMPISFDLSHDGLGVILESTPSAPAKVPSYGLKIDRVRLSGAQLVTANTVAGVAQDATMRYNVLLTVQATLDSGAQLHKSIGSFTVSVLPTGVIAGCERNTNMDIDNCASNNKIYMPYPIPGTNSANPQYLPDQYGCISPDIISTANPIVTAGPVLPGPVLPGPVIPGPGPGPGPKPSDEILKKYFRAFQNQTSGEAEFLKSEKIFKLINTFKKQNLVIQNLEVQIESQKRVYEKN